VLQGSAKLAGPLQRLVTMGIEAGIKPGDLYADEGAKGLQIVFNFLAAVKSPEPGGNAKP